MPSVRLPTNARGWFVALASSMVGFVAGMIALSWLSKGMR